MKKLIVDIETSPNLADVWGLFNQNVGLSQLRDTTRMISFAAKWHKDPEIIFSSDFHNGRKEMVLSIHDLLSEADVAIHYNGMGFDEKHINREILLEMGRPAAPWQSVDLLRVVKKKFRFSSNKLAHIAAQLGVENKEGHEGHTLWVKCMAGDREAWDKMRSYNRQDVVVTEQVYDKLLPWIDGHPNVNLYEGEDGLCPTCGSINIQKRGFTYTGISKFQRFQCTDCGKWSKSGTSEHRVDIRSAA